MRISDWSSDVCSSDLLNLSDTALFMSVVILGGVALQWPLGRLSDRFDRHRVIVGTLVGVTATSLAIALTGAPGLLLMGLEIGRASCRERVGQYVLIPGVAVTLKKQRK